MAHGCIFFKNHTKAAVIAEPVAQTGQIQRIIGQQPVQYGLGFRDVDDQGYAMIVG